MLTQETTYYDNTLSGEITENGSIKELFGKEAFENSIILWLISTEGDIVRNPDSGGYIIPHLLKPMTDRRVIDIKQAIKMGLSTDYPEDVIIESIVVTPDYVNSLYAIVLKGYSKKLKSAFDVDTQLKAYISR